MLVADPDGMHLHELVTHVQDARSRDALRYLVALAAEDVEHRCFPHRKGAVLDFRFMKDGIQPYAVLVNRESLLFYFRRPGIATGRWSKDVLQRHFKDVSENERDEIKVRLRDIDDVKRLWALLTPASDFKSGSTPSTTIGYLNRNDQRCAGHRDMRGTDHGQVAYRMECQVHNCHHVYGANGTDIFQRKCPRCQGGATGIDF